MIAIVAALGLVLAVDAGDGGVAADAQADGSDAAVADAGVSPLDGGGPELVPVPPSAPVVPAPPPLGRVGGQILSKGTRRPIAGASLTADTTPVGETDEQGNFAVEIPCGRRRLWVHAVGFEALVTAVDPCIDDQTKLVMRLTPAPRDRGHETVIRSDPQSQPKVRLEAEELTTTPGTLGDPFRAVESLPGVATVAWPAPIYAVRGSNPGNTGFFLDGVRVPALFHFALGPSVIHPYFFDSLEFYPGGYPARFGRYIAGIVAAETRAPANDRIHVAADVRLFDAGVMASTPLPGGGTVAVAARYSYTGALVSLLNDRVRVEYRDYQVRADRSVGPVRLTLLFFGSSDLLSPTGSVTREVVLRFHRLNLRAVAPLAGGRLSGSVALGEDHSRAPIADVYPITVDALSAAPRLSYLRSVGPVDLLAGFDGEIIRYSPVQTVVRPVGEWDLGQRRTARLLAGYLSATLVAGARLTLTPELRLDSYAVSGSQASDLGPRLAGRVLVAHKIWIKAAGGRFSQLPSLPLQIPGAESFGLRLFGLQSSWLASTGVVTTRLPGWEMDLTGYVQRYVLTDLRDSTPSDPDPLAEDFLIRRDALSYGVEVLIRRPLVERLHGWLSYTLSNNLRSFGGGVIGPSDWDQRHIFNLVAGYRVGRYTFGGRVHLNTGRPYPIQNLNQQLFARLPTFYQVDLRLDRAFVFDKFLLHFYLELVNATFSRQVYGLGFTPPNQITENSFRIVLPSIGVRGEF